jgi:hypothetical protein
MSEFDDSGYYQSPIHKAVEYDHPYGPSVAEACCPDYSESESFVDFVDYRKLMAAYFLGVLFHRGLEGDPAVNQSFKLADAILNHD